MLNLLSARSGPKGVIRTYHHGLLGPVSVLVLWGEAGSADVIHIETDRQRRRWRDALAQVIDNAAKCRPKRPKKRLLRKNPSNGEARRAGK